jgi:hypothetical protein
MSWVLLSVPDDHVSEGFRLRLVTNIAAHGLLVNASFVNE